MARPIAHCRVHLLVHAKYFRTEGVANDGVLVGMQGELPRSTVSMSFLPAGDETELVESLIGEALERSECVCSGGWRPSQFLTLDEENNDADEG